METINAVAAPAAIAQESRLAVFRLLVGPAPPAWPPEKISEAAGIPPSSLSFHLKELAHAGMVTSRQEGRFVIYEANFSTATNPVAFLTENCCGGGVQPVLHHGSREGVGMRLRHLSDPDSLPALDKSFAIERPALGLAPDAPPVRILLLYGSLRARSFSRLAVEEAARLLQFFGAETRIFDPSDLPLPDQVQSDDHPAVKELRALSEWSEGQVWCSPERHGQITSVMKAQIDHLPLEMAGIRPTQGRTTP